MVERLGIELKVGDIVKTNNRHNSSIMKVKTIVSETDSIYLEIIDQNGFPTNWTTVNSGEYYGLIPFTLNSRAPWYLIPLPMKPVKSLTKFKF